MNAGNIELVGKDSKDVLVPFTLHAYIHAFPAFRSPNFTLL